MPGGGIQGGAVLRVLTAVRLTRLVIETKGPRIDGAADAKMTRQRLDAERMQMGDVIRVLGGRGGGGFAFMFFVADVESGFAAVDRGGGDHFARIFELSVVNESFATTHDSFAVAVASVHRVAVERTAASGVARPIVFMRQSDAEED